MAFATGVPMPNLPNALDYSDLELRGATFCFTFAATTCSNMKQKVLR